MTSVYKFGGTSLGSPERVINAARQIASAIDTQHQVAVVVSAMAGETNRLLGLAQEVSADQTASLRDLDMLVTTGEQASAALLSIALNSLNIPSQAYTASQLPISTDGNYGKARITGVKTDIIKSALQTGHVPIVTGFQGIDNQGDINTLGRGGSDTTAVALAVALSADECLIYTDVDGVYTADPRLVDKARKLNILSFEEMLEMASQGSKVLQIRSVELAARYGMPLRVKSSLRQGPGTLITNEEDTLEKLENAEIAGISHVLNAAKITVRGVPDKPGLAAQVLAPIADANINVDIIVQNVGSDTTDLSFTVEKQDIEKATEILRANIKHIGAREIATDSSIAKISIVGVGMRSHAGVASKMFSVLAEEKINIQMISTSEIKVTVVIEEKYTELAVRALHTAFDLDEDQAPNNLN